MLFERAFIITHSPQQVRAVIDEAYRLGYTAVHKPNYKYVEAVVFHADGNLTLKVYHSDLHRDYLRVNGYKEIKQTRHIRRDLCGNTYSQDGLAVLEVVPNDYTPKLIDVEPYKWLKPNASNPIVQWVADKAIKVLNTLRTVAVAFIKHIK